MKIQSICPTLLNLFYFKYTAGEHKYSKISFDKSQYVYRIILIDKGTLDVCVGGKTERLKAGDALYLLPGEIYRLLPCGEDFSLYNLFFYFLDEPPVREGRHTNCVFMNCYDAKLCLPQIEIEDAEVLNKSGVIKNVSSAEALRLLLSKDRSDTLYCFYTRATLLSVIADILSAAQVEKRKSSKAEQILEYIRSNPEKDLSGDALSSLFSYHKNHINKLIKQETGKSLSEYTRYVKIEYAKILLSEELYSTTEVAMRLGYYDYSHFYKAFLLETGARPTEYLSIKG